MQINGRNAISWEEKFALDVWYVDNWSLWLDLKILALTIWKIIKREGINQPGQATAEEFNPQISQINADYEKEGKITNPQISQINADYEKEGKITNPQISQISAD